MSQLSPLSTLIDAQVKKAATEFCKRRGLKLRSLVEQALVEQLEDEMDLEAYHQRRSEETIPLEKILAGRKSRKS
ncbi:MAG: hypothetical protein HYT76_10290 [Deltaproteobacteria bacterium]|nr:hypothetical protein [Deltaproteobacteria bacterium]